MTQSERTAITRQKILTAAEEEFSKNGFSASRVDNIARAAGVNKERMYANFENKEGLYCAVLEIVYKRLSEYEDIITNSECTGLDTVRSIVLEYFDFLVKNPSFVRLMLWENLNNAQYVGNIRATLFSGAEKLLRQGIEKGYFREELDVEQTAMSMSMFCFSAFSNVHTVSKLLGKDLTQKEELRKRAGHIADVLTRFVQK